MTSLRLFVALLAVTAMVARAIIPLPAAVPGSKVVSPDLALFGATLCHSGSGPGDSSPAGEPVCDHCPLCVVALPVPPVVAAQILDLPSLSIDVSPAAWITTGLPAQSPLGWANKPRGPPSDI